MKTIIKILILSGLIGLMVFSFGCHKNNLPPNSVTNYKLIPNYDFEKWISTWNPAYTFTGWKTNATYETSVTEIDVDSINVYHGRYAMKLFATWPGAWASATTKFPITVHPLSLRAFVKCKLVPSDTVSIWIKIFFKGKETDSGAWFGTKSVDSYKQVNIPISQHSTLVDTALIEIRGGNHFLNNQPGKGSEFWVDYLSLQLPQ